MKIYVPFTTPPTSAALEIQYLIVRIHFSINMYTGYGGLFKQHWQHKMYNLIMKWDYSFEAVALDQLGYLSIDIKTLPGWISNSKEEVGERCATLAGDPG